MNLFTRPRRFGKSLNMSMLKSFFEIGTDKELFRTLNIAKESALCEMYMGKFPVISISLKGMNADSYEKALEMAVQNVRGEARRFQYLLDSDRLTSYDKEAFVELLQKNMTEGTLCTSLKILSELLEKHHSCKVILLIDEYDVPLAKAFERGYYDKMVLFIRNMLEHTLKTNDSLKFSVLTGCMCISKESIFTGLNNLKDMYDSIDNLWSVLFTTGYLTQRGKSKENCFQLTIPNLEIRNIFTTQIMDFFKENVSKNGDALRTFCEALKNGNAGDVEKQLSEYLRRTISIRDTFVKEQMKENFYHGILLGILGFEDTWSVSSNREAGDGYSDILVETDDGETGILLELKYAEDGNLDAACEKALRQMEQKKYEEALLDEGVIHILKYGISFYKKRCCVKLVGVC